MLETCFCHLQGIGPATEKKLRDAGIFCWNDALNAVSLPPGKALGADFLKDVEESARRLEQGDALWFSDRLPPAEQWRLYPYFYGSSAFVDIETTGLSWPDGQITTIALYDGRTLKTYVQGRNLQDFVRDVEEYTLLVTWNGRCFDAPFIRRSFNVPLKMAHLDLLPVFRALGLRGGLKKVEKELGLNREDLDGVDGFMAILLWREYVFNGNPNALETLLAYNAEDVFSLEFLSRHACESYGCPVESGAVLPGNPFRADRVLVEKLLRKIEARRVY